MSKRHWVFVSVAVLGVAAIEGCGKVETTPSPPATAGGAGKTTGAGGAPGGAAQGGTRPVVAGGMNEPTGEAGESVNDAAVAGAAGSSGAGAAGTIAGSAGATPGGGAGTTTGGSAGTTTGGSAGVGGTLPTGGSACVSGMSSTGGTAGLDPLTFTFGEQATAFGWVLVGANNHTLYALTTDTPATSTAPPVTTCSGSCLAVWPIYYTFNLFTYWPLGLVATDFGSYDRGCGVLQSTYKGWPLYTYSPDSAVGDAKGEGVDGKWYSVKIGFTSPRPATFALSETTLGPVIGTPRSFSLYVLTTDTPATSTASPVSTCSGACLAVWPIFYAAPLGAPPGLLESDFGSFDRGGGVLQSTYKGWPLYTYSLETFGGEVLGEGVDGKWYTAKSPFVLP